MLKRRQRAKEDRQFWKPLGRFERRLRMARRYNLDGMMNPLGGIETPFGTDDAWTPRRLFANNEVGGWWDPSDFSTMFQDAAGTTPVTGVEQPVGLHLDKSKGLALGSELWSSFNTMDAPWTSLGGGSFSIDGSQASNKDLLQSPLYTTGVFYKTVFTLSGVTGGTVNVFTGEGTGKSLGNGTHTYYGYASQSYLLFRAGAGVAATVSGISVKTLAGNHRYQSTSAARPTLSARYNQALMTPMTSLAGSAGSQYPNASGWADLFNTGGTRSYVASGVLSSHDALNIAGVTAARSVIGFSFTALSSTTYTVSFEIESVSGVTGIVAYATGTLGTGGTSNNITAPSSTGRVSYTFTTGTSAGTVTCRFGIGASGNESGSIRISGIDIRVANDGVGLPAYQRVNTSTDYDTSGFPMYLKYDGTDDFMQTASVDFSGTDKVSIFGGWRKLDDTVRILFEVGTNYSGSSGSFVAVSGNDNGFNGWSSGARGAAAAAINQFSGAATYSGPDTAVLSAIHDIAGDLSTLRRNAVAATNGTGDKGAGNLLNGVIYFGARAGTSLFFNGREYQTIIRGAASSAAEIAAAESFVNTKTKAY